MTLEIFIFIFLSLLATENLQNHLFKKKKFNSFFAFWRYFASRKTLLGSFLNILLAMYRQNENSKN
jgi:hypothetical protein